MRELYYFLNIFAVFMVANKVYKRKKSQVKSTVDNWYILFENYLMIISSE